MGRKAYWKNSVKDQGDHSYHTYINRGEIFYKSVFDELVKMISKDVKILEIGCNVGGNLNYLYNLGFTNLKGIDINQTAIEAGEKIYPHIDLSLSDALPFMKQLNNNEYDVIFTVGCLMNIPPEDNEIYSHINRVSSLFIMTKEQGYYDDKFNSFDIVFKKTFEDNKNKPKLTLFKKKQKINAT